MVFASPHLLWLLILWLPLFWWCQVRGRRQQRWARSIGAAPRRWRGVAGVFAVLFLIVGLADPRLPGDGPDRLDGVDVMVVWDHSASMLAGRDGLRFERSREELLGLVQSGVVDRMGVVAFAGAAEVVCPLTRDHAVLEELIDARRPQQMAVGGSDLLLGLREAASRLDPDRRSVLLLIADGEPWDRGVPQGAWPGATGELGVPVYAWCAEAADGAQLFETIGRVREPLRDGQGQPVFSHAAPDRLEALVRASGGRLLRSLNSRSLVLSLARDEVAARAGLRAFRGVWIVVWSLLLLELILRGRS